MRVCVCVQTSSGLGPGRDNEIITLIKPQQAEWSSPSRSFSPLCLLVFPCFPLSASALFSQADSCADSLCHSHAAAAAAASVHGAAAEAYSANPAVV